MVQYEIKIKGNVQGVGFRFFVQQKANETGISGWVKNLMDGAVLVMALGEETDMKTFIDYLSRGPALARVDEVLKNRMNISSGFSGFRVKY